MLSFIYAPGTTHGLDFFTIHKYKMDVFSLTETEFYRQLTAGDETNLHILYRDFVIRIVELCHNSKKKAYVIYALLVVEIEITHLQSEAGRNNVNIALASFITKALHFIRETISNVKSMDMTIVPDEDIISNIDIRWQEKKVALIELAYAFKVAQCFGEDTSVKDIAMTLAKAFGVEMTDNYIYKKRNEMELRSKSDKAYFISGLIKKLNNHISMPENCESDH